MVSHITNLAIDFLSSVLDPPCLRTIPGIEVESVSSGNADPDNQFATNCTLSPVNTVSRISGRVLHYDVLLIRVGWLLG